MLCSEIAQGGFSIVYKARDCHTGETFALKKVLCQTHEHIQSVKREIQTHKTFNHPNIMPLKDYAVVATGLETSFEYYLLFPFMEVRAACSVGFFLDAKAADASDFCGVVDRMGHCVT